MEEIIKVTDIKREKGYIYFVGTNEEGNLIIKRTKAGRRKSNESTQNRGY